MRRLAFLLKPQWLALYVVAIAFAYLCFTVLAPWQLGKNTSTERENAQISSSLSADPVPVTTYLPRQDSVAPDAQWHRVTATGRYLPEAQILVRLRSIEGEPAYEVLVPFAVDRGPVILVNRGYVKPTEGTGVPAFDAVPTGTVSITGRLRDAEGVPRDKAPLREDGALQVYSINPAQVTDLTGVPLAGSYVQLVGGQPGGLTEIPLPQLDAGPFLSYGIQWIAFGIIAPIGVGYFVVAEARARRRDRAAAEAQAASSAPLTTEERLADRYGKRR
ncbi:SURF1 family cytochrome oxidase biogenesis protein [Mycolicibacterium arenosum]|uniref:SURF1-like protein n=1 Tax=Mycolicibacterium arenosum TaxID=2952157 RepID=A0ABT1MB44_9MYCO|nr:SURF1 family protein [Mycolicibacterium sp. CAU 1645]MCP9276381.1 SURF1 family protein [Mycolicibacterium sp. CAU 1645]